MSHPLILLEGKPGQIWVFVYTYWSDDEKSSDQMALVRPLFVVGRISINEFSLSPS